MNLLSLSVDQQALPSMAFFLHMYQPPIPIQTVSVLKRIINNSYIPLTRKLLENSNFRLSININASLTEMLLEYEGEEIIDNLKLLGESNQIEFLESACYHPILPLLDAEYQKIQISLNRKINKKIFGSSFNPRGFFPPELAVNRKLPYLLKEMNYKYSIFPSTSFPSNFNMGIPYLLIENKKFFLLPRNRAISNDLSFKKFVSPEEFAKAVNHYSEGNELSTPIIGMDFETFGEHHKKYEDFLISSSEKLRILQLADLVQLHEFSKSDYKINSEDFVSSSWSTDDKTELIPFPLWNHPTNSLHQLTLVLMNILTEGLNYIEGIKSNESQLIPFLKAQQSCQLWWQSEGRFGPEFIKRAIEFQITSLNNLSELTESQNPEKVAVLKMLLKIADKVVKQIYNVVEIKTKMQ